MPPDLAPGPTKEEQKRASKIGAQGAVAMVISKDCKVVDAGMLRASSSEAVEILLSRARSMQFRARPGCGVFKTMVNFTLAG
jgi:hypothetical protein